MPVRRGLVPGEGRSRMKKKKLPPGVLKFKKGYNPNSSSIGTVVYSFPYAFIAVSAGLALLAALVKKKKKPDKETEKNRTEQN